MTAFALEVEPYIVAVFCTFFRVSAFFALMPGFGEPTVSIRVKLVLSLCFTALVFPMVPMFEAAKTTLIDIVGLLLTESLLGAFLGVGLRLLFIGLQTAGTIAAQSTSLSQVFGNAGVEPMPAMGHVLAVGGLALAMFAGLHTKAVLLLVASYELFPMGSLIDGVDLAAWGTLQVATSFRLAFSLAVPFVILSMLYNLALGVINKAMPQLMVAFVGAPAITLGGLFLLFSAAPTMLLLWRDALERYLANPIGAW